MDTFLQFLEPYMERSKKMEVYPLFLVLQGIDWEVFSNDDNTYIVMPKNQWGDEIMDIAIECISDIEVSMTRNVSGIEIDENDVCLSIKDSKHDRYIEDDLIYLEILWDPTFDIKAYLDKDLNNSWIEDMRKEAQSHTFRPDAGIVQHHFWPLYNAVVPMHSRVYKGEKIPIHHAQIQVKCGVIPDDERRKLFPEASE